MKDMYGRIMIDVEGTSLSQQDRELISNGNVGGIILFSKNFNSFEQISDLVNEIHAIKENILLAVDQEGGRVQRFSKDFTQLPSLQDLAKYSEINNDPDICKEVAWLTSSELIAAGIDLNFAPVLDIDESNSAIIGDRSFSSKTDEVIKHAEKYIEGMHEAGMQATAKHFPGHGGVSEDSHVILPEDKRSLELLMRSDIQPYIKLNKKIDAIMCAHILYSLIDDKIPSYSKFWIRDIIRKELNFEGVIFSDDLSMAGAGEESCRVKAAKSIEAGCDMVLICNNRKDAISTINYFDELGIKPSKKISNLKKTTNIDWDELTNFERTINIKHTLKNMRS